MHDCYCLYSLHPSQKGRNLAEKQKLQLPGMTLAQYMQENGYNCMITNRFKFDTVTSLQACLRLRFYCRILSCNWEIPII